MKNQIDRISDIYRPAERRRRDFDEVERALSTDELVAQAGRCMDCGVPFCHGFGCPLGNVIPEINAAVAAGRWETAWRTLSATSCFPEFTSRVCPALCEGSCTGGIDSESVMVRQIEKAVVEHAYASGWVQPVIPAKRNGFSVAVIGGGPAGLAAAWQLNAAGFKVTLFERNLRAGGLLRYGIPDFKLAKTVVERRIEIMKRSGVDFVFGAEVGKDISGAYLMRNFDCLLVAAGTPSARDLKLPGRELQGVHFALEFLQGQNRVNSGELAAPPLSAADKNVVVIGGGDTGSDCVGTALRQGAKSVLQIEIMPKPPEARSASTPWPLWPYLLRTSSSHREGGERRWNVSTKAFAGEGGRVIGLECVAVEWQFSPDGRPLKFTETANSAHFIPADLVLLAMGFTGVPQEGLIAGLGLQVDSRGRVAADPDRNVFVAGDSANGASLVVRAIADGKRAAAEIISKFEGGK